MMNGFLCSECECYVDSERPNNQRVCEECTKNGKFEKIFWPIAFIPILVFLYIAMTSSGGA